MYNCINFRRKLIHKKSKEIRNTLVCKDIDGNVYNTVKIGNQLWTSENLRVIHYNDGTDIPYTTSNVIWCKLSTHIYCIYGPFNSNTILKTYGA